MKILIVVTAFDVGGITTACVNFSNELIYRGNEVTILNMSGKDNPTPNTLHKDVKIKYLDKKRQHFNTTLNTIKTKKGVLSKIKSLFIGVRKKLLNKKGKWLQTFFKGYSVEGEYDVAIAYRQCAPCYYFTLNCVNARKKLAFVHGDINFMGDISSWQLYMQSFDKIAYVSKAVEEGFVKKYPNLKSNACVIYNVLEIDKTEALATQPCDVNIDNNVFNIVTVARIENEIKRIDWIIKVCKILNEKCDKKYHWYIVGDGPDYNYNKKLVNNFKLNNNITFVGYKNNPYNIVKNCKLFVLPTKTEAYPMVVLESLLLQVPPLVTRYSSSDEQIINNKTGIIVNSFDDLVLNLQNILENDDLLQNLKNNLSKTKFSNDLAYSQFLTALGGLEK